MKISVETMQVATDQAIELLKALANLYRLMIICQLIEGERSVGELAASLGIRDSTVSQHLALLRKDGLVPRRDGQTIWYAISSTPARKLLQTLYRVYCAAGAPCGPGAKGKLGHSKSRDIARGQYPETGFASEKLSVSSGMPHNQTE